jgi:hypothetical protein
MASINVKNNFAGIWHVFRASWKTFILLGTMYVVVSQGLNAASDIVVNEILKVIRLLALALTTIALTVTAHGISEGRSIDPGEGLAISLKFFWRYVWTVFLYFLVVGAGLILFLIPGIIWGIKYLFSPYIVVVEGVAGRKALARSAAVTKGKKIHIVLHELIFAFLFGLLKLALTALIGILVGIISGKPFIGFGETRPEWAEAVGLFGNIAWEILFIIFNVLFLKSLIGKTALQLDTRHSLPSQG